MRVVHKLRTKGSNKEIITESLRISGKLLEIIQELNNKLEGYDWIVISYSILSDDGEILFERKIK